MRLSEYCKGSQIIASLERDSQYKSFADSLSHTLDCLSNRFRVELAYDEFTTPRRGRDNEMLFKVYRDNKDVMWVYFLYSKTRYDAQYISIEVDDRYIKGIKNSLNGFIKTIERKSYPNNKFEFRDYDSISSSLVMICDAIENTSPTKKTALISDDINTPLRPQKVIKYNDGSIRYVCTRCGSSFAKSPRCPECGQLIESSEAATVIKEWTKSICVGDNIAGLKIYEIINTYFGENYKGWMQATYTINEDYWAWFPTITPHNIRPDGDYGGKVMWSNTVSKDRKTVISMNHDATTNDLSEYERNNPIKREKVLIFARMQGGFEFLGVFDDKIVIENKTLTFRHDRIAKGINLSTFELIEEDKQ